jgi:hypothetical protein
MRIDEPTSCTNGVSRTSRLETGENVAQHHCVRCGRDIVTVLSSGSRHAGYASVLYFYRLSDEVTTRWLSEPCLGSA